MAESKIIPPETEREQLQEDIERLQLVLQADDELHSEDSDDENVLRIDTDVQDGNQDIKPGSSTLSGKYREVTHDDINEEDIEVIQLNEESELPINPETTLALNRAYQELLLDSLRKIEVALAENRDKQNCLEAELEEQGSKKEKSDPGTTKKNNINNFSVPYFKNASGKSPPVNIDVQMKQMLDERKQDIKPPIQWQGYQRNLLLDAIKQDSLEQILRPMMNRKELEMEKLMGLQQEQQKEERLQCQRRIQEIDNEMEQAGNIPSDELLKLANEEKIDWLRISNMVFEGKREVKECQAMWKNALHPTINKEKWEKSEENALMALVERYRMRNWAKIAERLGTNRTAFQCLQYFQQNLNDAYSKREFTEEEDALLAEVVESCKQGNRISWNQVSYYIEGRNAQQCQQRWSHIDPVVRRGKWKTNEDAALLAAVQLYGSKDWCKIQQYITGRTAVQCRDRFVNALDPKLKPPASWTYEEDKQLIMLVNQFGGPMNCSWIKVANSLKGRTDNMVLNRFKRLMEWKKKCEWFDTQTDEAKKQLGLVDIRTQRRKMAEFRYGKYEELNRNEAIAYRLVEFNSGVHREDYLKQLQDKMNGSIVVPRPPLLYRYNPRSVMKVWEKKEQLQKLIEAHVNQIMRDKNTKPQDLARIPETTSELFKPLTIMSKRQKDKMENFLRERNVCDISVRELLQVTGKITKRGRAAITEKRLKQLKKDSDIERKIRDIIKWKSYRSFTSRCGRGRPKKYYLFNPKGNPLNTIEDNVNVEEMTKVTSGLFMNALGVNGKEAFKKSKTLSADDRKDLEREVELLENVHGGGISADQPPLQAKTQQLPNSSNPSQCESNNSSGTVTMATVISSDGNKNMCANSGNADKNSVICKTELSVISAGSGIAPVTSSEKKQSSSSSAMLEKGSESQVPGSQFHSVNPPDPEQVQGQTSSLQGQTTTAPVNQNPQVTQGSNKPLKPKNFPFLPPNVTSVHAFEALLMQRKLLVERAANSYNAPYYKRVVHDRQLVAGDFLKSGNKVDLSTVMKDMDTSVGSYALKGKRAADGKITKSEASKEKKAKTKGPDSSRDPLRNIRFTPEYALLRARFQAVFSWPSLLSTIVPPDVSELRFPEPNNELNANQEDKSSVQVPQKKSKFPCARSKHYYKWLLRGAEYRKERMRKIQESRKRNMLARLEGKEIVKEKVYKKKRHVGVKRVSTRIRERKNIEEIIKKMSTEEEYEESPVDKKLRLNIGRQKGLKANDRAIIDDTIMELIPNVGQNVVVSDQQNLQPVENLMYLKPDLLEISPPEQLQKNSKNQQPAVDNFNVSHTQTNHMNNVLTDTSVSENDPMFVALPVGQVDEKTGTLLPRSSEGAAYPVALVVNQYN